MRRRVVAWREPLAWMRSRSFAVRIGFTTSALIVSACVAVSGMFVRRDYAEIHRSLVDRGRTIVAFLARESELSAISGNVEALELLAQRVREQRDVVYCRFFDRAGQLLVSLGEAPAGGLASPTGAEDVSDPITSMPGVWEFQGDILTAARRPSREELEFFGSGGAAESGARQERVGTVALGISQRSLEQNRHLALIAAAFFTAIIALTAVLTAVLLARAFTRPLRALATAADAIAQGDLKTVVHVGTEDEMSAVAESFNGMVESLAQSRTILEEYSETLKARSERLEILNRELKEANRLKSEFLAQISHELRTPLNVIIGYVQMLADAAVGPVTDEQREMLASIERYSKLQLELISDVLDFSRLASGRVSFHVERFALAPLLSEVLELHNVRHHRAGLDVRLEAAPDLPVLHTDRVKLQEIIRNLFDNAVKFTEAGTVTIAARAGDDGATVIIDVRDTGPGIPAEELEFIFDEFRQVGESSLRSTQGVGLGLSIVKRLVGALGGTVTVSSRVGAGSCFSVRIPRRLPVDLPGGEQGPTHSDRADVGK